MKSVNQTRLENAIWTLEGIIASNKNSPAIPEFERRIAELKIIVDNEKIVKNHDNKTL